MKSSAKTASASCAEFADLVGFGAVSDYFMRFAFPTLLGNAIGGVTSSQF